MVSQSQKEKVAKLSGKFVNAVASDPEMNDLLASFCLDSIFLSTDRVRDAMCPSTLSRLGGDLIPEARQRENVLGHYVTFLNARTNLVSAIDLMPMAAISEISSLRAPDTLSLSSVEAGRGNARWNNVVRLTTNPEGVDTEGFQSVNLRTIASGSGETDPLL